VDGEERRSVGDHPRCAGGEPRCQLLAKVIGVVAILLYDQSDRAALYVGHENGGLPRAARVIQSFQNIQFHSFIP
jgi:hypothetical protein